MNLCLQCETNHMKKIILKIIILFNDFFDEIISTSNYIQIYTEHIQVRATPMHLFFFTYKWKIRKVKKFL